jgi:hypothetical protein
MDTVPPVDSGAQTYDGATSSDGAKIPEAQADQEAAAGDASADGAADGASTADAPTDGGLTDVPVTPPSDAAMAEPTCNPNAKTTSPTAVPGIPTFATQPLITMTSDELTMAWVLPNAGSAEGGTAGVGVFVADRATTTDPFGTAIQIDAILDGGSFFAVERVAISGDGLTLIGVEVGATNMASFIRTARGQAFAPFDVTGPYAAIVQSLNPGELLGDPVVSSDNDDLAFSKYGLGAAVSVYESFRAGTSAWPTATPRSDLPLQTSTGHRKHPLSMSADRLTLFVWDDLSNAAYGAIRNSPTGDYSVTEPYGSLFSLQTNGACNRFYYVSQSGTTYTVSQVQAM